MKTFGAGKGFICIHCFPSQKAMLSFGCVITPRKPETHKRVTYLKSSLVTYLFRTNAELKSLLNSFHTTELRKQKSGGEASDLSSESLYKVSQTRPTNINSFSHGYTKQLLSHEKV